jgi:hypothetical protein
MSGVFAFFSGQITGADVCFVRNILLSKDACGNADLKSPVACAASPMNERNGW